MSKHHHTLDSQVILIQKAMQEAGVWSETIPEWVKSFDQDTIPDIWQWMQFIYLPMRLSGSGEEIEYLAPKINAYIKNNPALIPILQLTIELDALTPIFQKSKM